MLLDRLGPGPDTARAGAGPYMLRCVRRCACACARVRVHELAGRCGPVRVLI
jgi:hypothetical protein